MIPGLGQEDQDIKVIFDCVVKASLEYNEFMPLKKDHAANSLKLPVSLLGSLPFCMARSLTLTILCRVPGILERRNTGHYSKCF